MEYRKKSRQIKKWSCHPASLDDVLLADWIKDVVSLN